MKTVEQALDLMPFRTPAFLVKTTDNERMVSEVQFRYLMLQVAKKEIKPFQYYAKEEDCFIGWVTCKDDGSLPNNVFDANNIESSNSLGICTEFKFAMLKIKFKKQDD